MSSSLEDRLSKYAQDFLEQDNFENIFKDATSYMENIPVDTNLIKIYEQTCVFHKKRYEKDSNSNSSLFLLNNWAKNSLVLAFLTQYHIDHNKKGGNLSYSAKPLFDLFEKTKNSIYLKKIIFLEERAVETFPITSKMLLVNSYSNIAKASKVYVKSNNRQIFAREKIYYLEKNLNCERCAADILLLLEDNFSKQRAIESLVYATWSCVDLFTLTQNNKYLNLIENLSKRMISFTRENPQIELPSKFKILSNKISEILAKQKRPQLTLVKN